MRPPSAAPSAATTRTDPRTPNFFIAGAPKSGTTLVHHALERVPGVYMSSVKEPGFFTSPRELGRGLGYYLDAYFARAAGHEIRGESTPWYLYSDLARERIGRLDPGAKPKILVLVRKPSTRALSMHLDQVRLNRERRSFEQAVDDEIVGLARSEFHPDVRQRYVWGGLYHKQIVKWRETVGPENVHVALLEELSADPDTMWHELADFLGQDLGRSRLQTVDDRDRNRSGVLRWPRIDAFLRSYEGRDLTVVEAAKSVLPPGLHRRLLQRFGRLNRIPVDDPADVKEETLDLLDSFYEAEVARMEALLGRELSVWKDQPETAAATDPSPLRVLHLVARSHRRGAELVAVELADELDRLGHLNEVVALGPAVDGGHERGLQPIDDSTRVGLVDLFVRVRKIRRMLKDDPVDLVLAHGGWAAQVAVLATPRRGPFLAWQRILGFPDDVWQPRRERWWRYVAGRCDAVIALTEDLADEMRRLRFVGPVWVIPNSRQPERFLEVDRGMASSRLHSELGIAADVPLIGFVGHLVRQKRPERALVALREIHDTGCPAHLVVAGAGELLDTLRAEAVRLEIASSVTFLGHRPDVEHVFGGVDVALLTSDAEGIPGVAIEALMAGCPLVTYPVGGVAEVVDDGVSGIVLSRPDPVLMAREVVALLSDADRLAAMAAESRRQSGRFTAAATAQLYADHLLALIAERNR